MADDIDALMLDAELKRRIETSYCSFCGKSQHEVECLIAGPTVFICGECVELCLPIVEEHKTNNAKYRAWRKRWIEHVLSLPSK